MPVAGPRGRARYAPGGWLRAEALPSGSTKAGMTPFLRNTDLGGQADTALTTLALLYGLRSWFLTLANLERAGGAHRLSVTEHVDDRHKRVIQ